MKRRALEYLLAKEPGFVASGKDVDWLLDLYERAIGLSVEMDHCPACAGYITWHRCDL